VTSQGAEHLRESHALLRPQTAIAAARALRGATHRAAIEGLAEVLYPPHPARLAVAAIASLEGHSDPLVHDALVAALDSPHPSVRAEVVASLHRRGPGSFVEPLARRLRQDSSWPVRRAALRALAQTERETRWRILSAADDPHWRVRHALLQVLLAWGDTDERRQEIDERLARLEGARAQGVRSFLDYRWSGRPPASAPTPDLPDPPTMCSFWDWDPAVLLRDLERMGEAGRRQALGTMPFLLGHADERIRGVAADALRAWGEAPLLAEAVALLDEPRSEAAESVVKLLASLDLDRVEETARLLLHREAVSPAQLAWAIDQAGVVFPIEEEQAVLVALLAQAGEHAPAVRAALVRLASRRGGAHVGPTLLRFLADPDPLVQADALSGLDTQVNRETRPSTEDLRRLLASPSAAVRVGAVRLVEGSPEAEDLLGPLAADPDAAVRVALVEYLAGFQEPWAQELFARLQADPHPHVRAAALTPARAQELAAEPTRETSWHVLGRAARLARISLWRLEPAKPWQPDEEMTPDPESLHLLHGETPHARLLGPQKLLVPPVGLSGHYGLPVEGFVRGVEAGMTLLFWESNYHTLTEFAGRLNAADRNALSFLVGTFEAEGKRVRRDAERALRMLGVERLALFLIFWVQSWARVSPDVRETLERLKEEGKVASFGLSTHARPLAVEAMEAGWDPIMVRHSAAHRGAEERVLPRAVQFGTGLLTFNNTCYGRLLQPRAGLPAPSAADCYRFSLAQPGVTACLSAPATLEQLEDTLAVLRDPHLPEDRRAQLEVQGAALYEEEKVFQKLVRSL
jgi:hypothetical protein